MIVVAQMGAWPADAALWALGLLLAGAAIGAGFAIWWAGRRGRGLLSRAREQAAEMVREARSRAGAEARALLAQAEEDAHARQEAWAEEEQRRRKDLDEAEREADKRHRQLVDRDRALARRDQILGAREKEIDRRSAELDERHAAVEHRLEQVSVRLEEVSGLSRDEARRQLLDALRAEVRQAAAAEVRAIKEEVQLQADFEAAKIMALATERLASDFSAERTTSTVPLPDPSLRGRIIGSEGRNIRAFESLSGMQLVLDDNPAHVLISGFNPIRREVARRALEKLIEGGTIHPRKIQQVIAAMQRKVDQETQRAGKETIAHFGFKRVHPEIVSLLGRLKYRTSYGQNVLEHVREAAHICGIMAKELGLDQKLAQRAALLHDIGKAVDFEREGTHPEIGGELARRCGEPDVVVNAIESHHDDCEVIHPIAVLVAAADALSGARPGARRRTTVDYIRRITRLEELGGSFDGVDSCYALQAGRELRVIVDAGKLDDDHAALLSHDLSQRIQSEVDYPGRIKITVIRQLRAQAVAR
ncbi:MAG TPA: ribonuclease Y [Acidobacteria bacterium]|nr:ribonuclease Y [Acidobacteriota bacterium]